MTRAVPALIIALLLPLAARSEHVRVVYLVPSDRDPRPEYAAAIEGAVLQLQAWYKKEMRSAAQPEGVTFALHAPVVEVVLTTNPAAFYPGSGGQAEFFYSVADDAFALTGAQFDDPLNRWIFYIDAEPGAGQVNDAATRGVAVIGARDLIGLLGDDPNGAPATEFIGGLGHELAHTLGLPHPEHCERGDTGRLCESALSYRGFLKWPESFLTAEEKAILAASPFMNAQPQIVAAATPYLTTPADSFALADSLYKFQITAGNAPLAFEAHDLPAGLTLNTSTGIISGLPTQAGTFFVVLGATNAAGTSYASLTLEVRTRTVPLIKSVSVLLNPAHVNETVVFSAAVQSGDGSDLHYDWSFGDGTFGTGETATHTYRAAGQYGVSLSVTNASGSAVHTVRLQILPSSLSVTSATARLNFAATGRDGLLIQGVFLAPAEFTPENKNTSFFFGGLKREFVLDENGAAGREFVLSKSRAKAALPGAFTFRLNLQRENIAADLAAYGLQNMDVADTLLRVPLTLVIDGRSHSTFTTLKYSARAGGAGRAKQKL